VANGKTKLELTWIGKETRPRLEPRILIETPVRAPGANPSRSRPQVPDREPQRAPGRSRRPSALGRESIHDRRSQGCRPRSPRGSKPSTSAAASCPGRRSHRRDAGADRRAPMGISARSSAEGAPSRSSLTAAENMGRAPEKRAHIRTALPSSIGRLPPFVDRLSVDWPSASRRRRSQIRPQ